MVVKTTTKIDCCGPCEDRTHDLGVISTTLCDWKRTNCYSAIVKIKAKLAFSSLQDRILRAIIYFRKEWGSHGSDSSQNVFLSHYPSHQTLQCSDRRLPWLLEKREKHKSLGSRIHSKCNALILWRSLDTLPAFMRRDKCGGIKNPKKERKG